VGTTAANSVAFVGTTSVRVTVPGLAAGTYPVYLVNPDGGTAIRVPGVTYSASPSWQTASSFADQYDGVVLSLSLVATDAATYTLTSGSLPPGLTLNANTGVISGTVTGVTVDTTYTFTVVATDAQLQDSPRTFTVTITVSDPYFKLTTLLLTGNSGTTVVTDSSTNNFAITVVGDSCASNFSPYLTGWSNYFDGNGDYLTVPTNAGFQFGTGDFTIECWIYKSSAANGPIVDARGSAIAAAYAAYIDASNFPYFYDGTSYTSSVAITNSQWNHVAFVRTAGTLKIFVNGVQGFSATLSSTLSPSQTVFIGGQNFGASASYTTGYISNLRIVKGTAVYTANFTPATTTLTAVANTSLLTCHANRLVDSSTNNFAITRNGDVRVESFNPFNITNSGTTGSMYFDGTGDYLSVADNAAFSFGSSDFTIEMWAKTTQSGYIAGIGKWQTGQLSWLIRTDDTSTGKWEFFYSTTGSNYVQTSGVNIKDGAWHHLAVSRSGANIRLFTDGVLSNTNTANPTIYTSTAPVVVGSDQGAQFFNGYISDVRVVKGTAVYTSNFTPPTAPVTNIANTQLLTLQRRQPPNNHTFQDSSSNNFLITRSGNATQGTFSPFSQSGWSNYFNGTNSYLTTNSSTLMDVTSASQSFTIEAWIYPQGINASGPQNYRFTSILSKGVVYLSFGYTSTGVLRWYTYNGSENYINSSAGIIQNNAWQHIAVVSNAGAITLYVNGISVATGSLVVPNGGTGVSPKIGAADTNAAADFLSGYISNLRITNTVVYNAAFTPGAMPLAAISGTQLLVCQSNRFVDNSSSPKTLTINGSPSVQAFSPFAPTAVYSPTIHGGSAFLDGSGDTLTYPADPPSDLSGTIDYTIEAWVYLTGYGSSADVSFSIINRFEPVGGAGYLYGIIGGGADQGKVKFYGTGGSINLLSTNQVPIQSWNHLALVKNGTNYTHYLNGVVNGTATTATTVNTSSNSVKIGQYGGYSDTFKGYLTNLRVVKGTAVYTSAFTPPTSQLTAIINTTLLLNFTNDAIEDATGRNVLETVGDARTTSAVTKWAGSHSMYFDGTGDCLQALNSALFSLGNADFTFELWAYITQQNSNQYYYFFGKRPSTGNQNYLSLGVRNNVTVLAFATSSSGAWGSVTFGNINVSLNTWTHFALSRNGSNINVFVNGVKDTSASITTASSVVDNTNPFFIGTGTTDVGGEFYVGYIQDFRATRYARYTANFTAPTAPARLK